MNTLSQQKVSPASSVRPPDQNARENAVIRDRNRFDQAPIPLTRGGLGRQNLGDTNTGPATTNALIKFLMDFMSRGKDRVSSFNEEQRRVRAPNAIPPINTALQ